MEDASFNYYKNALLSNLCEEYKAEWRAKRNDKLALIKLALRQQSLPHVASFAYQGKGVTKEYMLKEFGEYLNGYVVNDADKVKGYTYTWYVDYDYDNDIDVTCDVTHISWTKDKTLVVPKCKAPILYVSNKSDVAIVGDGYNSITIYLFDESKVTLEDIDEESVVNVYKYSNDCKVEKGKYCLGKVFEHNKELKL